MTRSLTNGLVKCSCVEIVELHAWELNRSRLQYLMENSCNMKSLKTLEITDKRWRRVVEANASMSSKSEEINTPYGKLRLHQFFCNFQQESSGILGLLSFDKITSFGVTSYHLA